MELERTEKAEERMLRKIISTAKKSETLKIDP